MQGAEEFLDNVVIARHEAIFQDWQPDQADCRAATVYIFQRHGPLARNDEMCFICDSEARSNDN